MANVPDRTWAMAFARRSTSEKMIAILSLALMPLGIIALLASLQSTRTADAQRRSELRIAATEATRKLSTELASDIFALKQAGRDMDTNLANPAPCVRVQALLDARGSAGVPFALFGPDAAPICASGRLAISRPVLSGPDDVAVASADNALDVLVRSPGGNIAVARYSPEMLASFARPSGYGSPYQLSVDIDGHPLVIEDREAKTLLSRTESVSLPVGLANMSVTMTTSRAPFGATEALLTFLPLLMWASAAIVAFYVVERLLIRPLKSLRSAVASYRPGAADPPAVAATPAIEIQELWSSFTTFADDLAEREQQLESALADQVRLTREVHHRVKNNLQVIASLISLHARDTKLTDAQGAYASIQRRVDALAIVHRNHFAELEQNRGIDLRTLLSELAGNFRANASNVGSPLTVSLSADVLSVDQDIAMPLAFLFTELAEVAMNRDPSQPLVVSARQATPTTARVEMASPAFAGKSLPEGPAARIIEGLARQLRSTLHHNVEHGAYAVEFAISTDVVGT